MKSRRGNFQLFLNNSYLFLWLLLMATLLKWLLLLTATPFVTWYNSVWEVVSLRIFSDNCIVKNVSENVSIFIASNFCDFPNAAF